MQTQTPEIKFPRLVPQHRGTRFPAFEAGQGRAEKAALKLAIDQSVELHAAAERARQNAAHDRQQIASVNYQQGEQKGYVQGQTLGWLQGAIGGALITCIAVWVTPFVQQAVSAATKLF
jgi:flagellar biosynthesis/type III secretory pathway protein FliH